MTAWRPPTCDIPGCHRQARKCERLEPRNLHSLYARLCPDHARRRGYTPVHSHGFITGTRKDAA